MQNVTPRAAARNRISLGAILAAIALSSCVIPGIDEEPPSTPSDVSVVAVTPDFNGDEPAYGAVVSWSGSASSWEVWRAMGATGDFQAIASASSSGFSDHNLPRGVSVRYRVRAVNKGGTSDFSDIASAVTPTVGADRYETGATGKSDGSVWTETSIADGASHVHSIYEPLTGSAADIDMMTLSGQAGAFYRVETRSWDGDAPDTAISVIDGAMGVLASDDDGGTGSFSRLDWWECPATGTYFVRVTGTSTGWYTVETEEYVGESVMAFPYAQTFDGILASPWDGWRQDEVVKSEGAQSLATPDTADGERSSVKLMIDAPAEGLSVAFDWAVNSEAVKDVFSFIVDGTATDAISGNKGWATVNRTLSQGRHVIEWRYEKDAEGATAYDRGWLDNLSIR